MRILNVSYFFPCDFVDVDVTIKCQILTTWYYEDLFMK
jgi:hypothetical protein